MSRCPAVRFPEGDRCTKPEGHRDLSKKDVWHSARGIDPHDGEPYGVAWRYMPALTSGVAS